MKKTKLFSRKLILLNLAGVLMLALGCSSVNQNTKSKAGMGALLGAAAGGIIGHQSDHALEGALIGAAAGAAGGALIGQAQDRKEERRQDELAAQRAHEQEMARIQVEERALQAERDQQLALVEGKRLTETEIQSAQQRAAEAERRLQELQTQRDSALARHQTYQDAERRRQEAEAKIQELEGEMSTN